MIGPPDRYPLWRHTYGSATPFWYFLASEYTNIEESDRLYTALSPECEEYSNAIGEGTVDVDGTRVDPPWIRALPGRDVILHILEELRRCHPEGRRDPFYSEDGYNHGTYYCGVDTDPICDADPSCGVRSVRCSTTPDCDPVAEDCDPGCVPKVSTPALDGEPLYSVEETSDSYAAVFFDFVDRALFRDGRHPRFESAMLEDFTFGGRFQRYVAFRRFLVQNYLNDPVPMPMTPLHSDSRGDFYRLKSFGAHYHEIEYAGIPESGGMLIDIHLERGRSATILGGSEMPPEVEVRGHVFYIDGDEAVMDEWLGSRHYWFEVDVDHEVLVPARADHDRAVLVLTAYEGTYIPGLATCSPGDIAADLTTFECSGGVYIIRMRPDSDGDLFADDDDNCPDVSNHTQRDTNDDGVGDACEPGDMALFDRWIPTSGRLRTPCPWAPSGNMVLTGDVVEIDYRTYANSLQGRCSTPYDHRLVPWRGQDIQLRWCSCLDSLDSLDRDGDMNEFIENQSDCVRYYCPADGDPLAGRNYVNRVGWFEPLYSGYGVPNPTLRYEESDGSWPFSFIDLMSESWEDHDGDSRPRELMYYSGPVEDREYLASCPTDPSIDEPSPAIEDRSHLNRFRWDWVHEYLPVPGGRGWGAQTPFPMGPEGNEHCVMVWLQTQLHGPDANRYAYPNGPRWDRQCLNFTCQLLLVHNRILDLRGISPGRWFDAMRRIGRPFMGEIPLGLGAGFEELLYSAQVGPRASIEGLVLQPYDLEQDLLGQPLVSAFLTGSQQIEGSGLRFVAARVPWNPESYGGYPSDEPLPPFGEEYLYDVLLAHGGAYRDGTFEDGVWLGVVKDDEGLVLWRGPIAMGYSPPRARGVFLASPWSYDAAVLFGGESEQGLHDDLWVYRATNDWWQEYEARGDVPSPRADAAFIQSEDMERAYLFGGRTAAGSNGELFELDLETLTFERLWPAGAGIGPEPRVDAALALDEPTSTLLLYGGVDANGPRNDLWAFNLVGRTWQRLARQCASGVCPPLASSALAYFDGSSARTRVVLGRSDVPYEEPTWSLSTTAGWTNEATIAQDRSQDCDGDGEPEPGYGLLCQSTSAWWAPVGAARCGTEALACAAPAATSSVTARVMLPGTREIAVTGSAALVRRQLRVQALDMTDPGNPQLAGSAALSGRSRDMVVRGSTAYVAAGRQVDVVDLLDPLSPEVVGSVTLRDRALGVATVGDLVVVTTRQGLSVIDAGDPTVPEEVSFLWLRQGRRGGVEAALDEGGRSRRRGCPLRGAPLSGPLPVVRVGSQVVIGAGRDLLVVDVSDPISPTLIATLRLDRPVRGLRASGAFVYVESPHHRGPLPVVDVTDPFHPRIAGAHELRAWVRGAVGQEDWAYRAKSWGVQLASVER